MQTTNKTPITESNEFFNAQDKTYGDPVVGFFEEIYDAEINKCYGVRMVEGLPKRRMGNTWRIKHTFTSDFEVIKYGQPLVIKASKKQPKVCWLAIQVLQAKGK